ncbi:MAG: hypothetical protein GF401_08035 [Chitinivibrionales bacterium]|nr:hypothetical protein [Chitinivibrionales bacterium]
MKRKQQPALTILFVVFALSISSAQIVLDGSYYNGGHIRSRGVADNRSVYTKVDSIVTETHIVNGIATTRLIMVLRPDFYRQYVKSYTDSVIYVQGRPVLLEDQDWLEKAIDSVEITATFGLPADFVAESLFLWINNEPVAGQIQDRNLASAQYNDIVGVRKDPALLEYHGNGSYNLRIFPARSNQARKICIVFHHTLDDDSLNLITASVPLTFDSSNVSYDVDPKMGKTIGYMKASFSTSDNRQYTVTMPGLGRGEFSPGKALMLENYTIGKLDSGIIVADDPTTGVEEFSWIGRDKVNGKLNIGFDMVLEESTVDLEDEPDTRIIVFDIRNEWWDWNTYNEQMYGFMDIQYDPHSDYEKINILRRAQKYAVLSLQNYVNDSQKFNIIFAGANAGPLFQAPVSPTPENLAAAYEAIRNARPDPAASTENALSHALDMAPDGIAILISDLYQPYNYGKNIYDRNGSYAGYEISDDGSAYDTLLSRIDKLVSQSNATLFTIADEYRLHSIANQTGGFQLASLRGMYYYGYRTYAYYDVDGVRKQVPQLPELYFDNPYNGGITDLEVISNEGVDGIVYTTDYSNYYYARGGIEPLILEDWYPGAQPRSTETLIRVAGTLTGGPQSQYSFTVKGKMGGLNFTRQVIAVPDDIPPAGESNDVQRAFRKTEYLANRNWYENAAAIKDIGKEYHIVTRQTSLLALEPWMQLWEDTISQNQDQARNGTETGAPAALSDMSYSGGSGDDVIDDISLDELISGSTPVQNSNVLRKTADITVRGSHLGLTILLPNQLSGKGITFTIFNVMGKKVYEKTLAPHDMGSRIVIGRSQMNITSGNYLLQIETDSHLRRFKVPLIK